LAAVFFLDRNLPNDGKPIIEIIAAIPMQDKTCNRISKRQGKKVDWTLKRSTDIVTWCD
jgi:hypothetical protein